MCRTKRLSLSLTFTATLRWLNYIYSVAFINVKFSALVVLPLTQHAAHCSHSQPCVSRLNRIEKSPGWMFTVHHTRSRAYVVFACHLYEGCVRCVYKQTPMYQSKGVPLTSPKFLVVKKIRLHRDRSYTQQSNRHQRNRRQWKQREPFAQGLRKLLLIRVGRRSFWCRTRKLYKSFIRRYKPIDWGVCRIGGID